MPRKSFYIEKSEPARANGYDLEAGILSTQKRKTNPPFRFAYLAIFNRPGVVCIRTRSIHQARDPRTRCEFIREVIDDFVKESSDIGLPHNKDILDAIYNKCDCLILRMIEPYSII